MRTLLRTANAISVTPRTTTFTLSPSWRRGMLLTTMISGEASTRPCASRAIRWSTMIRFADSRLQASFSSDCAPRCTTMTFSGEPVVRSAMRKPFEIATSTSITATTSAMPPMASSVTCQRTIRLRML